MKNKLDKDTKIRLILLAIFLLSGIPTAKVLEREIEKGSSKVMAGTGIPVAQEYEIRWQMPAPMQKMGEWCKPATEREWVCEEFTGVILNATKHDSETLVSEMNGKIYYFPIARGKTVIKDGVVYSRVSMRDGFINNMLVLGKDGKVGKYIQGR